MADYKDYIVRYDIQADVTKATEGLRAIADIAKQFETPMQTLAESITRVSQAAFQLKQNSQIKFTPQIDLSAFNSQLRKMVVDVRAAATEMHAALFEALSGNPMATNAMKKGANNALSSPKNIAQIKRDIESFERELDKIYGTRKKNKKGETIRNRDGSIFYAKKANMHERVAELEGQGRAIRLRISQLKADMAALEKLEEKAAAATTKTAKKGTVAGKPQAAPVTNVTPAVIRQWKQAFGDARLKNLTINIKGNASGPKGALTVIEQVMASLKALQSQASFTINPSLNVEQFAATEAKLRSLAALSAKIVAPFGGQTGKTVAGKGKNVAGKGGAPLAVDVIGNVTSIAPPKTELIVPVVGEIIKLQNKVTETIPVNAKIAAGSLAESLKGKNRPTIPANIKLMWEKGAIGRQAQLKSISEKIPPIKLVLDTTAAIAKLEEFVTLIKASSPQNIVLTASGSASTGVAATGVGSGTTGTQAAKRSRNSQPQTAQERYQEFRQKAAERAIKQKGDQRLRTSKIAEYSSQQKAWYAQRQAMYNRLFEAVPKPDYGWARRAEMQRASELSAMRADAMIAFAKPTPFEQQEAAAINAANEQREQARKAASQQSILRHQRQAQRLTTQFRNEVMPWVSNESQLNTVLKHRKYFKEAMTLTGINPMSSSTSSAQLLQYYRGVAHRMRINDVPVPWQLQDQIRKIAQQQRKDAAEAAKVQKKEDALAKKQSVQQSIARHQQQANRLRAQAQNAMLPFAQNKEQLNMLTKNRRYFRQAVATTGITPTVGMGSQQMLSYLQGVSTQMQQANVAVPWQLQSQINKLQGQIANTGASSASSSRGMMPVPMQQKPFFDRARKWAYPFTGQTSFGVRTPMAVDMAKGMGVMFAIGGAMSAIGNSFSQAMEYQNTMRTTQAILQNGTDSYSQSAFKNMEAIVRNVGVKTKFSAPEVASAARFLAMAGYDIDAINASIRPIADLALIGDSDLGETADKMTNIMTTFGIKPGQMRGAANIMATTATRSNTDLMMLAESAKYGGGVANMYGRNDPNLFADTMALFGVMGNAGIQASSAGTALRMMYQNLFKPNKNQKKVLEMMKSEYGISTLNEDGSYRAMSSILTEMAQRIPENKMAEIVGNLFRITAQPGAAAALMAAAGGDKTAAEEIGTGIDIMSARMSSKAGLSSLVSLMLANRESINGNISGAIAEEKQNTIQGLLAQVTSTFTEGILKAFEQRQGRFEGMLKGLRDYLAKPETVSMLQNLLDMVIEIGKVMAWFVKVWANLYNMCPGLIKFWVITQMCFTQIGTLISPFISLIGVFNRLGGAIARFAGISATATVATSRAATGGVGAAALNAPFILGPGRLGVPNAIRGNAAVRANRAIADNTLMAMGLTTNIVDYAKTKVALDNQTRQHYAAVQARAKRMYGWSRVGRAFRSGASATLSFASLAPMFGGISKMFIGLMSGLAKAVGLLCNPITLAIAAAGGLTYGFYKLYQFANGNTEAQLQAQKRMAEASEKATRAMAENYSWFTEQIDKWKHPSISIDATPKSETQIRLEKQTEKFKAQSADTIADLTKDASYKAIDDNIKSWRERINNNPLNKFAIGNDYEKLVGSGLEEDNSRLTYNGYDDGANLGTVIYNLFSGAKNHAKEVQSRRIQGDIRIAGAGDPAILEASNKIVELREQYLNKAITESAYQEQANAIRDKIVSLNDLQDPTLKSSVGMTLEDYSNISDYSVYKEYKQGLYNVLTSLINGDEGSIVSKMDAYYNLQNGVRAYSESWWRSIREVIGDFPVTMNVITEQGVKAVQDIIVKMKPDGTIDYNGIIKQITNKIGAFHKNLQDFANMTASIYQQLVELGYITQEEADDLSWKSVEHQHLTKDMLVEYYHTLPASHPWKKAHKTAEEYADFVNQSNSKIQFGGRTWYSSKERVYIRRQIAARAKNRIVSAGQEMVDKANQLSGGNPTVDQNPTSQVNPTGTPPPPAYAGPQDVYASHYDSSTARPTMINININELAHFDRTSVASSAQERDLMAAMEEKIAESIYRLSMTALNNVNSYMV